ncbi:MAG: DUF6801 domain-containing protein [Actinomadura sp.]
MGVAARWTRGRLSRTAVIGGVLVTMGVLPGAGGTAAAETTDVDMAYGCQFPSGPQQVEVRVSASLPKAGAVGQAVLPGEPTITVTVPQAALGDVTKLDAATVGATVRLAVQVVQPGTSDATAWQDLTADQTVLPQGEGLTFEASGTAPAVTLSAPGEATFAADRLDIELVPLKADGAATSPAVIPLACTPVIGYDTVIGSVTVTDIPGAGTGRQDTGTGRQGQAGQAAALAESGFCPPQPPPGFNPKFPLPEIPPGATPVTSEQGPANYMCADVAGLSNVKKLNGAAPVAGIGSLNINMRTVFSIPNNQLQNVSIVQANLEPQRATLLTFGFMPVSATMELTQLGNINVAIVQRALATGPPLVATASGEVSLRLTDARVNGVALDLGPNCRAAQPIELILRGGEQFENPYDIQPGGTLRGEITIPPFTGCGAREDLDPLLTASVSGPGNLVRAVQGPLCRAAGQLSLSNPCPPVTYGVTVEPGGNWTATTPEFSMSNVFAQPDFLLSCRSVEMTGTFKSGTGLDPQAIGTVTGFTGECGGAGPPLTGREITVTPQGLPWVLDMKQYNPATRTIEGHFRGISLHVSMEGCSFDLSQPNATPNQGNATFAYDNSTRVLSLPGLGPGFLNPSNINGCTDGFTSPIRTSHQMRLRSDVVFEPEQTITRP